MIDDETLWRVYLMLWDRAPDRVSYCRGCEYEAGAGHGEGCPVDVIETEIWIRRSMPRFDPDPA